MCNIMQKKKFNINQKIASCFQFIINIVYTYIIKDSYGICI